MRSQSRAGFTLIELMVALALTMFLMVILTQCFVLSLEIFADARETQATCSRICTSPPHSWR